MKKYISFLLTISLLFPLPVIAEENTSSNTQTQLSSTWWVIQESFNLLSLDEMTSNADGLVAEYLLNGNANDTWPNNFHGTVYSATLTTGRNGEPNTAYDFDGSNDGIIFSGMTGYIPSKSFSVNTWVNIESFSANIWSYHDTDFKSVIFYGMDPYFRVWMDSNNRLRLAQKIGWGWHYSQSTNTLPTNTWIHLAATHNGQTWEDGLYINGNKVNTSSFSSGWNYERYYNSQYENALWARKYNSSWPNTNFFNGKIDEIQMYDKALSLTEIQNLYNYGSLAGNSTTNITSLTSSQTEINRINQSSIDLSINGITDTDDGNTITYSYSFDNQTYTTLPNPHTSPINNESYSFNLDLSSQADGELTIYVRANDGLENSNTLSLTLQKDTAIQTPTQPTNLTNNSNDSNSLSYTWTDNANNDNQEEKYVLKDEAGNIIADNLAENTQTFIETGLTPNTTYSRQVCAVNEAGETCSTLVAFKTKVQVTEGKVTNFSFLWINIDVIETLEMFKVVFSIWDFKINFSIEKNS